MSRKPSKKKRSQSEEVRSTLAAEPQSGSDWVLRFLLFTAGMTGLFILTIGAYLPAAECGIITKDRANIEINDTLWAEGGLSQIWFEPDASPQYYPLVYSTYWLEYSSWEADPKGYHIVNVLLHALGALLLWRVLRVLEVPGGWLAAALFAVHPVHVESVAWITERKNVLSGVFFFAAALAYLRFSLGASTKPARAGLIYGLALILFGCALLSKTAAATLPFALLPVLWWKGKLNRALHWLAIMPFMALGVTFILMTDWIEKAAQNPGLEVPVASMAQWVLVTGRAVWFYAVELVWPVGLGYYHPEWSIDAGVWWQYLFPEVALLVLVLLWWGRSRWGRGPLAAVLFFVLALVVSPSFFRVYPDRASFVADHVQYLASAGLFALIAAGGCRLAGRFGRGVKGVFAVTAVLVVGALGLLSSRQTRVYVNLESFWIEALANNPEAWLAHENLARLAQAQGRVDDAIIHYADLESFWLDTLAENPEAWFAHQKLADVAQAQGRVDDAISHYEKVVEIDPTYAIGYSDLGQIYQRLGQLNEAISYYRKTLEIEPDNFAAHNNMGLAQLRRGAALNAMNEFRAAMKIDPDLIPLLRILSWTLATHPDPAVRSPEEAIEIAERMVELGVAQAQIPYDTAPLLDCLAAAYAAAGQFDRAIETQERVLEVVPENLIGGMREAYEARMALYKAGQTYQELPTVLGNMPPP